VIDHEQKQSREEVEKKQRHDVGRGQVLPEESRRPEKPHEGKKGKKM